MKLKNWIIGFLLFSGLGTALGQFGVSPRYAIHSYDTYGDAESWFDNNIEVGVNYWFRLKNKRIEFLPEVYYGFKDDLTLRWVTDVETFDKTYLGLEMNTQFYLLDFANDCNCPTFSKQGPNLNKSIYLSLAPGIEYKMIQSSHTLIDIVNKSTNVIPYVSAGLGADIGITDLFTLTPYINYRFHFAEEEIESFETDVISDKYTTLLAGIRLTFRPDYVRNNRR